MPANEFLGDGRERVRDRKAACFLFDLRQEHGFKDEIAKLFAKRRVIAAIDGFEHFVRFLEHLRLQRIDGLLAVRMGIPSGARSARDEIDQAEERIGG